MQKDREQHALLYENKHCVCRRNRKEPQCTVCKAGMDIEPPPPFQPPDDESRLTNFGGPKNGPCYNIVVDRDRLQP